MYERKVDSMKNLLVFVVLVAFVAALPCYAADETKAKEWTIMVFLNGDNNLEGAGIDDVNEMEAVGSTDKINIICQFDRRNGYDSSNGNWTDTKIFKIEKDNDRRTINSPVVKECGEVNMGDAAELVKFVKFCKANYPAKKYFLSIWNHGAAWYFNDEFSDVVKGISYDDSSSHAYMDTFELGKACAQIKTVLGKKLDIMDFDACLMAMPCIGFQMRPYVDFMVASEETEPGDGKPYDDYLAPLKKNPTMSPKNFAINVVKKYADSYSGGSQGNGSTTQSATDLNKLTTLSSAVKAFSKDLIANMGNIAEIKSAFRATLSYAMSDCKDLGHFAKLIKNKGICTDTADQVLKALKEVVVLSKTSGYSVNDSTGLAIWMPVAYKYKQTYKNLDWKVSEWHKFLEAYYAATKAPAISSADQVVAEQLNFIDRKAVLGHETDIYAEALTEKLINSIDSENISGIKALSAHIKNSDLDAQNPVIMNILKKVSEKLTNSYLENRSNKIKKMIDELR